MTASFLDREPGPVLFNFYVGESRDEEAFLQDLYKVESPFVCKDHRHRPSAKVASYQTSKGLNLRFPYKIPTIVPISYLFMKTH